MGLHLLDVFPMPWSGPGQIGMKRKGLLAALVPGLVFGVALGPRTFTSTSVVQRSLDWNERSRGAVVLRRVCGVLVLIGGLWLIYGAP